MDKGKLMSYNHKDDLQFVLWHLVQQEQVEDVLLPLEAKRCYQLLVEIVVENLQPYVATNLVFQ